MRNFKENSGITLIALVVTVIVLLIILSITVTIGLGGIGETKEDKLISELGIVQNAVLQQYYKYTVSKSASDIIGTEVQTTEIESIANDMGITLSEIYGTGKEYNYYRLTPEQLKEIGIRKAKDTYIVNYSTGEVINDTTKTTESGYELYIQGTSTVDASLSYIEDGLVLHYDGINNTGNGHSDTATVWKDLSGNNNDGTLRNFNFTTNSEWQENSLEFDGINDAVTITQMNYPNVTLEIVVSEKVIPSGEVCYITNAETGGYSIYRANSSTAKGISIYNAGVGYKFVYLTDNSNLINKKYSLGLTYDGNNASVYQSAIKHNTSSVTAVGYPVNNTVMALGCNPSGANPYSSYLNGNIYSVRIYNRALTDEEMLHNYNIDRARFGI